MALIISVLTFTLVLFLSGLDTAPVQYSPDQNRTVDDKDLEYAVEDEILVESIIVLEATLKEERSGIFGSGDDISDLKNYNVSSRVKRFNNAPKCGVVQDYASHGMGQKWNKASLTYFISNNPSKINPNTVQQLMQRAFKEWSKATNLDFNQVYRLPADINIVFGYSLHKNQYSTCGTQFESNILAHAFYPRTGEIHFNSKYYFDSYGTDAFLTTAIHEIGHALGLDHVYNQNSVMYPLFVKNFNALPTQDQEAVQSIYGKRRSAIPDQPTINIPTRSPTGSPIPSSTHGPIPSTTRSPIRLPTHSPINLPSRGPPHSPNTHNPIPD